MFKIGHCWRYLNNQQPILTILTDEVLIRNGRFRPLKFYDLYFKKNRIIIQFLLLHGSFNRFYEKAAVS